MLSEIEYLSIYDYIYNNNRKNLDDVCIICNKEYTYNDLFQNANKIINYLIHEGLKQGDMVACLSYGQVENIFLLLACSKLGINLINMRNTFSIPGTYELFDDFKIKHLFIHEKFFDDIYNTKISEIIDKIVLFEYKNPNQEKVIHHNKCVGIINNHNKLIKRNQYFYYQEIENFSSDISGLNNSGLLYKQIVFSVFTSGITGKSKVVQMSNQSAVNFLELYNNKRTIWQRGEVVYNNYPSHTMISTMFLTLLPLARGVKLIVSQLSLNNCDDVDDLSRDEMFDAIKKYNITILFLVKTFSFNYLLTQKRDSYDLSHVKFIIFGGESITSGEMNSLLSVLREYGYNHDIYNMYGISEIGTCIFDVVNSRNNQYSLELMDGIEVYIKKDGKMCEENEIGNIYIKSPSIMPCYLNDDEENKRFFDYNKYGDQLASTGDYGYFDDNHQLKILGRVNDSVIINGEYFFTISIDEIISKIKGVKQCFTLFKGIEGKRKLVTYMTLFEKVDDENELFKLIDKNLQDNNIEIRPTKYIVLDAMPFGPSPKLNIRKLMSE